MKKEKRDYKPVLIIGLIFFAFLFSMYLSYKEDSNSVTGFFMKDVNKTVPEKTGNEGTYGDSLFIVLFIILLVILLEYKRRKRRRL